MKAEELKGKTQDELQKTLLDLKKQQFNLRVQKSQGQLENTARIRAVRRDIARVKTFMGMLAAGKTVALKAAPKKKVEEEKVAPAKKAEAKKTAAKKAAAKKTAASKTKAEKAEKK